MSLSKISRRRFLPAIAALPSPAGAAAPTAAPPRRFRALSPKQAALIQQVAATMIPTDDTPGASEAAVVDYIDNLLAADLSYYRREFLTNLECFRRACQARFLRDFTRLQPSEKQAFLNLVEAGQAGGRWEPLSSPAFFALLRTLVFEGFFSDPVHGGNRNQSGWRMIGFQM